MSHSRWNAAEDSRPRTRQDAGKTSRAWRWFSNKTRLSAGQYSDLRWRRLGIELGLAVLLIVLARVFPNQGFAPFLLVGAVIWMALLIRICLIKLAAQRGWLKH